MIIQFDGVNWNSSSGPNSFANRLARALFERGHEISLDALNADVSLVFIERTGVPLASRIVQRLDGIWFSPDEFLTKNVGIKSLYEKADAIIWQSEFDKTMTTKWWGERNGSVIHNGIKKSPITSFTFPALEQIRSKYDKVFVSSAFWHPQKRLKTNTELFLKLRKFYPNSCYIVMGSQPDYVIADPHIFYTGAVPSDVYMQIYSMADWMIHLAYCDHCPNVVIESLSQETPVICSSAGGTKEIVGKFGLIINESYDYDLTHYDSPPDIDLSEFTTLPEKSALEKNFDVSIDKCVDEYLKVLAA
jgi:glycosyltransferase involved in cell wall biosynthesis